MRNISGKILLFISIFILTLIIILNTYSINLLKKEVYENHYTEEAELMAEGISKFYINKNNEHIEDFVKKDIIIEFLKSNSLAELEGYMINMSEYLDSEFIGLFNKNKQILYSSSSDREYEKSILEAYKGIYDDNLTEGIIEIPLIKEDKYNNSIFYRRNIVYNGEILGSVVISTKADDIVEYMNRFDEVSFILNPKGDIYIASQAPTNDFLNFIKKNNNDELSKIGKKEFNNFYFDVFDLNDQGWKIVILQSLSQLNFSWKIRNILNLSYILTIVLIILILLILRLQNTNDNIKKQFLRLKEAMDKTSVEVSIVNDKAKVLYSNHEYFNLIYEDPANEYFKSDILAAIRKEMNFEKEYSFEIDQKRKWFSLHLNMLDTFEDLNCAVISLNELTDEKLYQSRLENIVLYDKLTGCYNRYQGLNKIASDMQEADKIKELSIIFLDIDNLKYVNDNMGHNIGDLLIKTTINTVKEYTRIDDYCIRIGGDEFLIILPNCPYERAAKIIYMIDEKIESVKLDSYDYKISFSFGIVNRPNDISFNLESMINEADTKMYINKKLKKSDIIKQFDKS